MNKSVLALIVLASLATPAAAQAPLDVFLEQRVADELASDGTPLSRLGVVLEIEAVGDKLLVSLVDAATHRAVASTKVESVPADREAAVAALTQVAANLVAQVGTRGDAVAPAVDVADALARHSNAEYRYRQEMVTFERGVSVSTTAQPANNGTSGVMVGTTVAHYMQPVLGELKRPLGGRDFYLAVDRPDLADKYSSRRRRTLIGMLGGSATAVLGLYVFATNADSSCDPSQAAYDQCKSDFDHTHRPFMWLGGALMVGGAIGFIGGTYYLFRPHPVSVSEWYDLAEQHNASLRRKYGLGARASRTSKRSLVVAPYLAGAGGGFAVAGRF